MRKIIFLVAAVSSLLLASCVSTDVYDAMTYSRDSLQTISDSMNKVIIKNNRLIKKLQIEAEYLNNTIEDNRAKLLALTENYSKLKSTSSSMTQDLMDNIEKLQKGLAEKQQKMRSLNQKMKAIQAKLKAREDAMDNLKSKLQNALVGFAEKGMTVSVQNGKVYVSLSNQLLFSSGSTNIDVKGKEALLELSRVLNEQNDINILVEGHTDDQQLRAGARYKDNWDLSVMRATEVVRYITIEGNVNPNRIIASGRSEFFPIEKGESIESRAVNRRTEIILTPKLEELFDIIK